VQYKLLIQWVATGSVLDETAEMDQIATLLSYKGTV